MVLTDDGILIQDTTKTGKDRNLEVSNKVLDMLKSHRQRQTQMMVSLGRPKHVVKPEETLATIAAKLKITVDELVQENDIKDQSQVKPGDTIFFPRKELDLVFLSQKGTPVHPRRLDRCLKTLVESVNKKIMETAWN